MSASAEMTDEDRIKQKSSYKRHVAAQEELHRSTAQVGGIVVGLQKNLLIAP